MYQKYGDEFVWVKCFLNHASLCMGYVCGDNTNRNTKLAILEDLKGKFLNIFIFGKEGGVIGEERGVKSDAKSEYI